MTIDVDNENRVCWIIVIHINKIEIIYIFKEFENNKTIFVDDDRVNDIFWIKRFDKILRICLNLYICNLLSKLIEQLNKHLIDNRRNDDLNNRIKIVCHDWQLRIDLIVVYNFFDKRFTSICRIRVVKLIKLIELIFRKAQICNKRIIECFELVEWQTNLWLSFDKRIVDERIFNSKINRQKFQINWRDFVFNDDNVKLSNNNFENNSIDRSLERILDKLNCREDSNFTSLSLSLIFCRREIDDYYCVDNVSNAHWQLSNITMIWFKKNVDCKNNDDDFFNDDRKKIDCKRNFDKKRDIDDKWDIDDKRNQRVW